MKEELIKFLVKHQTLVLPAASAVVSLILLLLVILPQMVAYFKSQGQIADLAKKTQLLQIKVQQLQSKDKKSYADNLQVALIVLPSEKDIPAVIGQIQTLLSNNQLQLIGMNFINSNAVEVGQQTYGVKIDLAGDSTSLKNFLSQLKDTPQILKLNSLDETLARGGISQFEIVIQTYYSNLPTTIGAIDQPLSDLTAQDTELLKKLQKRVQSLPIVSSSNLIIPRGKTNPFQ